MTDYVDLASLKRYLRIPDTDDVDDLELGDAISTASSEVDQICDRTFGLADEPADFWGVPYWDPELRANVLDIPDLADPSDLEVFTWNATGEAWTDLVDMGSAPAPYPYLRPLGGPVFTKLVLPDTAWSAAYGDPSTPEQNVMVRATFGWADVPLGVKTATKMLAARIFKRRDAVFGMVNTLDGSEQSRLTRVVDPDVVNALRPYMKLWAAR